MATANSSQEFSTVIGADAKFKGELQFEGGVRIDGSFDGAIKTPGKVLISQKGQMKGEIDAGSTTVEGTVDGNLTAKDRIELNASCKLTGDIKASKLLVKEGAVFVGRCEVGGSLPPKTQKDTNVRAIADAAAGKK
ncbi:MAG: polymer-forming cytoskeletal protein [Planctomycetota bacterium]|nr:polymer-forming cytoskeletal protein [Planctomycetota bacterium]